MRIKGKTSDGFSLSDLVNTIAKFPNIIVKEGKRHELLLKYEVPIPNGYAGLCAVSTSSSYKAHILPWVKKVTGYDAYTVNSAIKQGCWSLN